jgi:hypothetical protein
MTVVACSGQKLPELYKSLPDIYHNHKGPFDVVIFNYGIKK